MPSVANVQVYAFFNNLPDCPGERSRSAAVYAGIQPQCLAAAAIAVGGVQANRKAALQAPWSAGRWSAAAHRGVAPPHQTITDGSRPHASLMRWARPAHALANYDHPSRSCRNPSPGTPTWRPPVQPQRRSLEQTHLAHIQIPHHGGKLSMHIARLRAAQFGRGGRRLCAQFATKSAIVKSVFVPDTLRRGMGWRQLAAPALHVEIHMSSSCHRAHQQQDIDLPA